MVLPNPVAFQVFGYPIYWYGIFIAAAVLLGILLSCRRGRHYGISSDAVIDYALICIPAAIVGARLYYVALEWDQYKDNLFSIVQTWHGGLAIYGGIIAAIIAAFFVSRHKKIPLAAMCDVAMPAVVLGQAIGRWGNFVNQEAFGNQVLDPSLQFFPYAVYIERLGQWHMATFFYESMACLLIFAFLLWYTKRAGRVGNVTLFYGLLYGIERFFVEGLRTDSLYLGDIRFSQALSLVLAIVCGGLLYLQWRKKRAEKVEVDPRLVMKRQDNAQEAQEDMVDDPTAFTDPQEIDELAALDGQMPSEEAQEEPEK